VKNFLLVEAPSSRVESHLLLRLGANIPDDQREVQIFSTYSRWLGETRGYATNTIQIYSEHVARFLDYLFEAAQLPEVQNENISFEQIVRGYEPFMLFGKNSDTPFVKKLAYRLSKDNCTSRISLAQSIESAIRWFFEVSSASANTGVIDPFFSQIFRQIPDYQSAAEKVRVKQNSWLAGTIRNSLSNIIPKQRKGRIFSRSARRANKSIKNRKSTPLPLKNAVDLMALPKPQKARRFYRDMAFYSLLAATGCRSHEALQLRLIDIKVTDEGHHLIELHNPFDRKNPGLTEAEERKLAWKTRETEKTFLLQPFADFFWRYLKLYLDREYISSVNHDFLFQKANGRPYFTSSRKNRDKAFKQRVATVNVGNSEMYGLHSLRHMYGTFVLNYLHVPGMRTSGLPMPYVQILMGHASIKSTEKYAKYDEDKIESFLAYANEQYRIGGSESIKDAELRFYERQIAAIQHTVESLKND